MSFLRPLNTLRRVEREEANVEYNVKMDFQQEPSFHHIVKRGEENQFAGAG